MGVVQETAHNKNFLDRITTRIRKAVSKDSEEESQSRSGLIFTIGGEEFIQDSHSRRSSAPEICVSKQSTSLQNEVSELVMTGWLSKRGEHIHIWKRRYYELIADGNLYEYKSKPAGNHTKPVHQLNLTDYYLVMPEKPRLHTFVIRHVMTGHVGCRNHTKPSSSNSGHTGIPCCESGHELMLCAHSDDQRESWMVSLKKFCKEKSCSLSSIHKKRTLEEFKFLKLIGKGSFGKVILCRDKDSNQLVALKVLQKCMVIEKEEVTHTLTENKVLHSIKHPFLIELQFSFQTSDRLCFAMEYVNGGDLYFHLSHDRVFTEQRAKFYSAEIVLALGYLHQNNIVYRDVKLENVLLDMEGHVKIADFGLCKEKMAFGDVTRTFCGTPEYLAPEVCAIYMERAVPKHDYGRAVDWWGTGVVMYEMMCGRLPFNNDIPDLLFQQIMTRDVRFPSSLSRDAVSILISLMDKDPSYRLGGDITDVEEVKSHQFFSDINWDDLYNKKILPPFKPQVESELDTRYFDETFTREPIILTPDTTDSAPNDESPFDNFSLCGDLMS